MFKQTASKILLFTSLTTALVLMYFFSFELAPLNERLLKKNLYGKIKTVSLLEEPKLAQAVRSKDDVALISEIENIKKVEDIKSVYILSSDYKAVVHDNVSSWGKIFDDKYSKQAVDAKREKVQSQPDGYLYSVPLVSSVTLCILFDNQRINDQLASAKINSLYAAAAIFVVVIALGYFFTRESVSKPFMELEGKLNSVLLGSGGRINVKRNDEFGKIYGILNSLILKFEGSGSRQSGEAGAEYKNLLVLANIAVKNAGFGVLLIDPANKIILVNELAAEFFKKQPADMLCRHILDVLDAAVISLIQKAGLSVGTKSEGSIGARKVSAVTALNTSGESCGTAVLIDMPSPVTNISKLEDK